MNISLPLPLSLSVKDKGRRKERAERDRDVCESFDRGGSCQAVSQFDIPILYTLVAPINNIRVLDST